MSQALSTSQERVDRSQVQLQSFSNLTEAPDLRSRRRPNREPPRVAFKISRSAKPSSGISSPLNEPERPINFGTPTEGSRSPPGERENLEGTRRGPWTEPAL